MISIVAMGNRDVGLFSLIHMACSVIKTYLLQNMVISDLQTTSAGRATGTVL